MDQTRINIAKLQFTKPFMPPFAGTAEELDALVQYLTWENAGRPTAWARSDDPRVIARIDKWLTEAGPDPATVSDGTVLSGWKSARAEARGSQERADVGVSSEKVGG